MTQFFVGDRVRVRKPPRTTTYAGRIGTVVGLKRDDATGAVVLYQVHLDGEPTHFAAGALASCLPICSASAASCSTSARVRAIRATLLARAARTLADRAARSAMIRSARTRKSARVMFGASGWWRGEGGAGASHL